MFEIASIYVLALASLFTVVGLFTIYTIYIFIMHWKYSHLHQNGQGEPYIELSDSYSRMSELVNYKMCSFYFGHIHDIFRIIMRTNWKFFWCLWQLSANIGGKKINTYKLYAHSHMHTYTNANTCIIHLPIRINCIIFFFKNFLHAPWTYRVKAANSDTIVVFFFHQPRVFTADPNIVKVN